MTVIGASACLAVVLLMSGQTRTDVDLWGHVRFGLDILRDGKLHDVDTYSFTSDRPWVNHEWLAEILMASAWRAGGGTGLILLKLACATGALLMVHGILRSRGVTGHARVLVLALTLLGILGRVAHVRPQLFSVFLFACLMRIFVAVDQGRTRALLLVVPVAMLWTNLHGGWLVGLGTIAVWCAGEAYVQRRTPATAVFAIACAALAGVATLVNPYGIGLWRFLATTVRFGRQAIVEWGPIWSTPASLLIWAVLILVLIGVLRQRPAVRNPASLALPIFWGVASLRVNRLDAFFALSMAGLLAAPVAQLLAGRPRPSAWNRTLTALTVTIAVFTLLAVPYSRRALTCIGFYEPRWPEPQAIAFMRERHLTGRLVTYFDWGEYAIWHLAPELKVSIDGRRETVYTDEPVQRHLDLYAGAPAGLEYFRRLQADYVWFPQGLPAVARLRELGWIPIFEGPRSVVLRDANQGEIEPVRVGEPPPESLPPRCFPGP